MPTNDARRDEIRKILLSLLLARPGAIPIPVLDRDYYEAEGERIPWRKFGYADVTEFLKSMPEHFVIEWCNGGHYVRGIASEKTKHVSSLVSRQKSTSKKYIAPRIHRPFINRYIPQMQRQRVRIPAEQLSYLVTFVKNNPNGVYLRDALAMLQKQLPHVMLSLYDMREQLHALPHSLYLDCDMIYPANDVSQEAKNYQQSSTLEPQKMPRSSAMETTCVGGDEGSDFLEDEDSEENSFVPIKYLNNNCPKKSKTSERLAASFTRNANNEQNAMFNHNDDVDVDEYFGASNNNDKPDTMTANYVDLSSLISDRTKSRLDQLVRKHPEGIWCADLPDKYLKEYNVHLNYTELGFTSVREYVSYLPNIFYMTRANSTDDFLLYSADKRPTVPDQEISKSEPIEISSSSREQYNEHNAVRTQHGDDDSAPIPANVSPTITMTFVPDDVMNYNDSVDLILVTDLQRDRKHLEIYVVEVFNPSFFWVHLRKNKRRFEIFMNELHTFYEYNKDKYIIPKIALKKGLNCACIYENNWHRAIIKSVKPDFKVTVIFYDFGTLKTYAPEDVYYLHKQFSFLPAQALPCGLYNVKPCVGDRWKKSVTDSLIDKIEGTLLALTIISVDPPNNSMMVILSDVSEEEDVHINDWLINEKLAQCGKMGDTVDMASIMKYVVNNLNQLPTYCFAEESLMSDSCSKAISIEKIHNKVPLVSSKQIHLGCNGLEQHSMIPPPGFAALPKNPVYLSSMPSKSFDDIYSSGNTSNVKTSYDNAEVTTNPFLSDQQFVNDNVISNDIAEQIFRPILNENLQLFITLSQILCDMVKCSPLNRKIFENHMTLQYHLNKFLKNFEKTLIPDNDQSVVSTSSTLLNPARETMSDKVGLAEKTPINSNTESFANRKLADMSNLSLNLARETTSDEVSLAKKTPINSNAENFVNRELVGMSNLSLSNPFDVKPPQIHNMFSAYCSNGSNGYTFANWHQSDGFNPRVQVPSPLTPTSAHSMFMNCGPSSANVFFPNTGQGNENSSATKPIPPIITINTGVSNNCNSSNFSDTVNSDMVFKETNPFKFSVVNDMQEKQTERMTNNYDTNSASYLSVKNLHDYSSKMEAANIHAANIGSIAAEHVNVNSAENHTPRIVYEAGPVMYNTQKKQTDANMKHNTGNSNLKNDCNVTLKKHCSNKELSSQSARHDSSHIDEDYVTQPSTDYILQDFPLIINSEPNYHQQNSNANERIVFPQTWKQVEIAERCITSQFRNGTPLQNHNKKPTFNKFVNFLSHKDWNCNNNKESETQNMNGMVDLSYIFQWNDKEKPLDNKNFWNNPSYNEKQKFIEYKNGNSDFFFDTSFVFQKIDSIKNATFIFHIEGEGWMLTHEFVEIFTNLKLCSRLIAMVEAMNIKAAFKEIQRSDHPVQFLQLDHYPLNVPRDSDNRIVSIHLISLPTAVSLLHKLKIVTREEIDNAFKKKEFLDGSVMLDMWMLIVIYRDLKQRIEFKLWNINA